METKFYWHIHHRRLLEPATEPIENRIEYIKCNKPPDEQELRLRLLKPVRSTLPPDVVAAGIACAQAEITSRHANDVFNQARYTRGISDSKEAEKRYTETLIDNNEKWYVFTQARDTLEKAIEDNLTTIESLHAMECPDCPWDEDTIFPHKPE